MDRSLFLTPPVRPHAPAAWVGPLRSVACAALLACAGTRWAGAAGVEVHGAETSADVVGITVDDAGPGQAEAMAPFPPLPDAQALVRTILATGPASRNGAWHRGPADLQLVGYMRLGPSLPERVRHLLGKPEGAVTVEWRQGPGLASQLGVGSLMRWQAGNGQMTLRLRGGKLGLQYGLRFNL